MTLEDQLIERLFTTYKDKGIDLSEVLHNPLFQGLTLDKKIQVLKEKGDSLISTPTFNYKKVGSGALAGGLGTFGTLLVEHALSKTPHFNPKVALIGAGVGAIIGGAIAAEKEKLKFDRQKQIHQSLQNKDYINTLVLNTIGYKDKPPSGVDPLEDNKYLKKLDTINTKAFTRFEPFFSSISSKNSTTSSPEKDNIINDIMEKFEPKG
jgi:hypothetical protein